MEGLVLIPRLNYDFRLQDAIKLTINSNDISETYFSSLLGTSHIYFTNLARTGLRLLLNATGLPAGAGIGVQAYNCNTVFESIHMAGYKPVFVDINELLTIDSQDLERKIEKIDALIITNTFGVPANWDQLKEIAGEKLIIEDCAHSFLSEYKGRLTGTLGDAAIFSFGNGKFPAIGTGGMVIIHNKIFLESFEKGYNELKESSSGFKEIVKNWLFTLVHQKMIYGNITSPFIKKIDRKADFGGKFRWDEEKLRPLYKRLILSKTSKFEYYLEKQQTHARRILDEISENIKCPIKNLPETMNYFMIPILTSNRDDIIKKFIKKGVETGAHFKNSLGWAGKFGYETGSCPIAEKVTEKILCIPTYYKLSDIEVDRIILAVKQILFS